MLLLGANFFLSFWSRPFSEGPWFAEKQRVCHSCLENDSPSGSVGCIATDKRGYYIIFFLFLHENICSGYPLEAPWRGTSNEYPQHIFSWRSKKDIGIFRMKKVPYLLLSRLLVQSQAGSHLLRPKIGTGFTFVWHSV